MRDCYELQRDMVTRFVLNPSTVLKFYKHPEVQDQSINYIRDYRIPKLITGFYMDAFFTPS